MVCINKPQHNTKVYCNRESVSYRVECINCKATHIPDEPELGVESPVDDEGDVAEYLGETCKSLYVRGKKHEDNYRLLNQDSFMLRHHLEMHSETPLGDLRFQFSIMKYHDTCFRGQIHKQWQLNSVQRAGRTH